MSIIETTLYFAGIPAAVILLVVGLVYAGGSRRNKRYRPGRPFEFTPVWFLSAPEQVAQAAEARALTGSRRAELTAGTAGSDGAGTAGSDKGEWPAEELVHEHATGGASDRW